MILCMFFCRHIDSVAYNSVSNSVNTCTYAGSNQSPSRSNLYCGLCGLSWQTKIRTNKIALTFFIHIVNQIYDACNHTHARKRRVCTYAHRRTHQCRSSAEHGMYD